MVIYIAADHRGFALKEEIKTFIQGLGYSVYDLGNTTLDPADDYPDFASAVAGKVSNDYENARGIVICGSGVGVDVVANKFPRVRSSLVMTPDQAFDARNDDDANILALPADYVRVDDVKRILTTWLGTPFANEERHRRRRDKISKIEIEIQEKSQ
ncbi:MAG: RpiB/LacA/LacB family sugar-phosphate isomerase [Patescibacteria group bacterium]